ncbi:MAG: hypothetical protein WCU00_04270 [Candidatus Latescibacterota bacterium]
MHADIRFPIGLLFSIIGIILTVYGFVTSGAEMYSHSLNININLYSGICLLIFGGVMLCMAIVAQKKQKAEDSKK